MSSSAFLSPVLAAVLLCSQPVFAQDNATTDGEVDTQTEENFDFLTEEEEAIAEFEQEIADSFAIFGELFKPEPLTKDQEARLPLAEKVAGIVMPEGTFSVIMQDSMEPMMSAIMGAVGSDPRFRLAQISGVGADGLDELSDEVAQEALDIFDPEYAARNDRMGELVVEMIGDMFAAIEPAYRDGYARALTTRFESSEMEELLAFIRTPLGEKFAQASFNVQYDPQMLGVMEQMGPAMVEVMPTMIESFEALEGEFAVERKFSELSDAERERAADLLGKSVPELDAMQPDEQQDADPEDAGLFEEA